ncbi:hypothetical protein, partial [Luteolibacter marinus]|uniref:hypothetical protein n=1 Tax=Luteolibacter marinus TaxID=2776705 RepID=UPI00186803C4
MSSRVSPIAALCAMASLVAPASAVVIDTFSDSDLSEYTLTRVLDNGVAESNIAFSSPSGSLQTTYSGTVNQAEQVLFLRDDYTLNVGQTIFLDTAFATTTAQMDFGLAIGAAAATAGASALDTDTRDTMDWLAVYVRPSQDAVRVTSSISGVVVTAAGVLGSGETLVSRLFITRTSATTFSAGFIDTSDVSHTNVTVDFSGSSSIGDAVGFYADLRAVGGTLGNVDNL